MLQVLEIFVTNVNLVLFYPCLKAFCGLCYAAKGFFILPSTVLSNHMSFLPTYSLSPVLFKTTGLLGGSRNYTIRFVLPHPSLSFLLGSLSLFSICEIPFILKISTSDVFLFEVFLTLLLHLPCLQ